MRLTAPQRRELEALARIRDGGSTGQAFWYPIGAEHLTARSLERRGLLQRHHRPSAYELTDAGYEAVRLA